MRKLALAAAATLAFAAPAFAQSGIGSAPWTLAEGSAYAVTPDGKMMTMGMSGHGMTMMMPHAKKVPRGTVFFMNNGVLYMMSRGAFDRAGNFMGGGG
jgi:hypothetical protein